MIDNGFRATSYLTSIFITGSVCPILNENQRGNCVHSRRTELHVNQLGKRIANQRLSFVADDIQICIQMIAGCLLIYSKEHKTSIRANCQIWLRLVGRFSVPYYFKFYF